MRKLVLFGSILLAVLLVGFGVYYRFFSQSPREREVVFDFPVNYKIEESSYHNDLGQYIEEKMTGPNSAAGKYGPPVMFAGIYRNSEGLSVEEWIKDHANNLSRYKSIQGQLVPAKVGGASGFAFDWKDARPGKETVVGDGGNIYYFTLIYNGPADPSLADYAAMLKSVRFE